MMHFRNRLELGYVKCGVDMHPLPGSPPKLTASGSPRSVSWPSGVRLTRPTITRDEDKFDGSGAGPTLTWRQMVGPIMVC